MKAEALDELLSHIENIHIPKERQLHEEPDRRLTELPLSCIYMYSTGPVRLRYKKTRSHMEKALRDGFSTRIEKECTPEQLHDRFNFDEDDFAAHPPPIPEEHIIKMDGISQDQRRINKGILKANARPQESHKCYCGKSYRSSNALRNHMITYHHTAKGSQIAADDP